MAHNQHVVRVDEEQATPASEPEAREILDRVRSLLPKADVLLLSDYAKGVLGPRVLAALIQAGHSANIPVVVDPKGHDYSRYNGATLLAPNAQEAALAAGIALDGPHAVEDAGRFLLEHVDVAAVVITQGEAGMTLFEPQKPPVRLTARARVVYDVTGAGDSVIAVLGLSLAAGADLASAGELANVAGGLAVEQVRTAVVTVEQIDRALKADD